MRYTTDIVVIDLEASCPAEDQGNNSIERSSIIEIGAVRLDRRSLEITAEFSELVRPEDHPIVPFITDITGIAPDMVKDKETFDSVGRRFLEWYGPRNKAIIVIPGLYKVFWGMYRISPSFGIGLSRRLFHGMRKQLKAFEINAEKD